MSRRNQARRRRSYGRRQHEVRERRSGRLTDVGWLGDSDERDWLPPDASDDRSGLDGEPFAGYSR